MFYTQILNPFLSTLRRFGDRNAFCINKTFYTYADFGRCVSKIRIALRHTTFANNKIGLVTNDDLETYASIFALWLEGYCYVPLSPDWPIERIKDICGQVELDLILDSSEQTKFENVKVISSTTLVYVEDCLALKENVPDENMAVILFTSGSTGKPKGVQVTRKSIAAFIKSYTQFQIGEKDHCLQCADLTFVVSVVNFLLPLLRGACLYTVPSDGVKYIQIGNLIEEENITVANFSPSVIKYLKPYLNEIDCSSLKYSLIGGDILRLDMAKDWAACASKAEIFVHYGSTEAILCSVYHYSRVEENKVYNGILSIGKPIKGCTMEIFNENLEIADTGELGELCISGEQLTCGYLNNPQKNEERFFIKDGSRWYRSGDLCYKDADGYIMYSGRMDYQVKVQGFRVELGEIEYHAREFLKDKNVVCVAFDNSAGLAEIAMFIESAEFKSDGLIAYMRSKMPYYMIPARILYIPTFPLNTNGKTDKLKMKGML